MTILDLLAQRGLSPVKATNMHGGEYVSPCPKCGGSDCFRVWPALNAQDNESGIWFCRRCSQGGDLKKFLQAFGEDSVDETEKKTTITPEERAERDWLASEHIKIFELMYAHHKGRYTPQTMIEEAARRAVEGDTVMKTGIELIAAERARHQELGWTAEHDDQHAPEELELAAACYAMPESFRLYGYVQQTGATPHLWPLADKYWKPSTRERDLEKAGALLAAALDLRMRRAVGGAGVGA